MVGLDGLVASTDKSKKPRSRRETASLAVDGCSDEQLADWLRQRYRNGLVAITRDQPADPWLSGGTRYNLFFDAPIDEVFVELDGGKRMPCPLPRLRGNFLLLVMNRG